MALFDSFTKIIHVLNKIIIALPRVYREPILRILINNEIKVAIIITYPIRITKISTLSAI